MLLVMDNLAGHLTARFVVWLFEHGIMPLYTPLSGSWLNMTESIQRILAGRALAGQTPANSDELIEWLEPLLAPGTPIRLRSSGAASVNSAANEPINVAIHLADLEHAHVNHYVVDSSSWTNGGLPVK